MRQKIKRGLVVAYQAFATEPNTLLAQAVIAALLFGLGTTATTRSQISPLAGNPIEITGRGLALARRFRRVA